jgi:hypothetical protein
MHGLSGNIPRSQIRIICRYRKKTLLHFLKAWLNLNRTQPPTV